MERRGSFSNLELKRSNSGAGMSDTFLTHPGPRLSSDTGQVVAGICDRFLIYFASSFDFRASGMQLRGGGGQTVKDWSEHGRWNLLGPDPLKGAASGFRGQLDFGL